MSTKHFASDCINLHLIKREKDAIRPNRGYDSRWRYQKRFSFSSLFVILDRC